MSYQIDSYLYPVPSFDGLPKAAVISALQACKPYIESKGTEYAGHSVCGALDTANIGAEIRREVKGRLQACLDGEPWVTWTEQCKRYMSRLEGKEPTWEDTQAYRLRWVDEMLKQLGA